MHFGIISPPVPGHIHPFGALGRELIERGHRVTFFHVPDIEDRIRAEGLGFVPIGEVSHPKGTLPRSLAALGRLHGLAALRFTIGEVAGTTRMMLHDGPDAIHNARVTALLVDQTEPAGGSIAEHLGLPFITVCNALAINRETWVPPPFTPWHYSTSWWAGLRNRIGYKIADRMTRPITTELARCRALWGLPPVRIPDDSFSPLAQISQQPALFDFPRRSLPENFYYVGPLRRSRPQPVPFPWERLDSRPLIYASLGTLQNSRLDVFRIFAEACQPFDAQLVISHGGGLTDAEASSLPGNPLVVSYAPQQELLSRARLTLTHAGLNTVLDSLSCGVPAIAIPIAYEQPAIAERLRRTGAGRIVPFSSLTVKRLRDEVRRMLSDQECRAHAQSLAASIHDAGGVARASDIILEKTQKRARG